MRKYTKGYEAIQKFYRSDRWKQARKIKILEAAGRCQKCGEVGTEVHHIIHLTPENVYDPKISIGQDNLILLCTSCHNQMHNRFVNTSEHCFDEDGNCIKRCK